MKRFSFSEILTLIIVTTVSVAVLLALSMWTVSLREEKEEESLLKAMRKVVDTDGVEELFRLAGIPTDMIYWGSELVPLFEGGEGKWEYTQDEARNIAVYRKCRSSVVQILAEAALSDSGQGSGVILTSDGYIVTNLHVIGSGSVFSIVFSDGSSGEAVLVGSDALTDLAVLKTDRSGLEPIETGTSTGLVVGQTLLAIGNPFGYSWSLTSGMVSGLGRMVSSSFSSGVSSVVPDMIQTNALINPGNSGGPLLDTGGRMVGLVSSIYSTSGTAEGISFALPVETVVNVARKIIRDGKASRGWLDILSVELNPQIVAYSSLPVEKGILISQVVPAGNADRCGLRGGSEKAQYGASVIYLGGDVIVEVAGRKIENYSDFFAALFSTAPGDKVDVTVVRGGQYVVVRDVVLVEQTEENTRWIVR